MSDKAERANRPEATVGEATGLAPAAEVARLEAALAAAEEDGNEKAGLLADLADTLFGDQERAERRGYDGLVERAAALVLDLGRARNEVVKALADTGAAEKRRMDAERAAVEAKGDAHRLRLVVEAKDRGLAAAEQTLLKVQRKIRLMFAAKKDGARTPESLDLSLVGDEWMVLYGEDVPRGIAGIGPTPDEAVVAFAAAVQEASAAAKVGDPAGGDLVVDGRPYKVPHGPEVPAEAVAAALREQGLDAFVDADGALTWRVADLPSKVEIAASGEPPRDALVPPLTEEQGIEEVRRERT